MNKDFLSSAILPESWDIYGWELKPFSLRIHLHLTALENPYVVGQPPTALDTFEFLKVCSNKSDDIFKIKNPSILQRLFYKRMIYDEKFHAKIYLRIVRYLKENTVNPNTTIKSQFKELDEYKEEVVKPQNTLPEQLLIVAIFANKLHIHPKETWNMPISMVGWYSNAIACIEGADVTVNSTSEADIQSDLDVLRRAEQDAAERLKLAMVNGKIKRQKIKLSTEQ